MSAVRSPQSIALTRFVPSVLSRLNFFVRLDQYERIDHTLGDHSFRSRCLPVSDDRGVRCLSPTHQTPQLCAGDFLLVDEKLRNSIEHFTIRAQALDNSFVTLRQQLFDLLL